MTRLALALILALVSTPLGAQWLKHPTPGMPRNADGTPNLTAPAPRMADGKPDLSGIWRINPGAYNGNVLADWKPEEIPAGLMPFTSSAWRTWGRTTRPPSNVFRRVRAPLSVEDGRRSFRLLV